MKQTNVYARHKARDQERKYAGEVARKYELVQARKVAINQKSVYAKKYQGTSQICMQERKPGTNK